MYNTFYQCINAIGSHVGYWKDFVIHYRKNYILNPVFRQLNSRTIHAKDRGVFWNFAIQYVLNLNLFFVAMMCAASCNDKICINGRGRT